MTDLLTIDCGDIILREYVKEDAYSIYEITSQPEVHKFLPDFKTTLEQRISWVENYEIPLNKEFLAALPNISNEMYLRLGIILKETNELIGFCLTGCKEELPEPNREIVYGISKHYRNKDYTTKAATGLIKFLFQHTNVEVLNAIALTNNISSNRVIEKLGFRYIGDIEIDNETFHHYKLLKE
jgi:[ribosomal protein S5]-alanine N-acetyltransferase